MRSFLLALSLLSFTPPAHAQPSFDYYLFRLSIAPDFCAASPRNAGKDEGRTLKLDTAHLKGPSLLAALPAKTSLAATWLTSKVRASLNRPTAGSRKDGGA